MNNCIFCKIAKGQAPALVVHETADLLCLLPLEMEVTGHTLIIARGHYQGVTDAPAILGQSVFDTCAFLFKLYQETLGATSFNLLVADGPDAQQSVPHFHAHFMPRYQNDGQDTWPKLTPPGISREDIYKRIMK